MRKRVIAAVASAVSLAAAFAIPALATGPTRNATPPSGIESAMVAAMQRDLGLTAAEARTRLANEDWARRAEPALRNRLGSAFGGSWLSVAGAALTVAVTHRRHFPVVRQAGATPVLVERSERQLITAHQRLGAVLTRAGKRAPTWYVDVPTNSVVVAAHRQSLAAVRRLVSSAGVAADAVRVAPTAESPRPLIDVIGGNAYYIGSGTRCSIGFSVNGGFVTAGHCGRTGASTSQPSGTFRGSSFPGNDYAWVQVGAGNTPRGLVNNYRGGTVPVAGSSDAPVGSSVCRSGSTTGWHCGTIQARNASVTYPQGTVNGLIRTSVCAEPGDSGGSLLAGNQAQGVTSGGSGNCSSGGTTYFQPVNEILQAYGLSLITSGGGDPSPTPTATASPTPTTSPTTPPPGGCGGLSAWSSSRSYTPDERVHHDGHAWTSTWWSTGAEPGAPESWAVWRDDGAC